MVNTGLEEAVREIIAEFWSEKKEKENVNPFTVILLIAMGKQTASKVVYLDILLGLSP